MSEIAIQSTAQGVNIDLAAGYTSITATDLATKKLVYAAVTSAESLKDHVGETITVVDVLSQPIADVDKNGNVEEYTRITLIAADGTAYSASSTGVLNSLNTAFKIFGPPAAWKADGGLAFIAREVQSPNNKAWRFVTLDIAD